MEMQEHLINNKLYWNHLQEFIIFTIFINKYIAEIIQHNTYLWRWNCPATSYVVAMFYPTIGQLYSLISQHNCHPWAGHAFHKELGNNMLTHSQNISTQSSQPTVGFIRLSIQANTQLGLSGYRKPSQYTYINNQTTSVLPVNTSNTCNSSVLLL